MSIRTLTLLFIWLGLVAHRSLCAQDQPSVSPDLNQIRHLYVPQSRLSSIFKADQLKATMSLTEFEALVAKAKANSENDTLLVSRPIVSSAVYQLSVDGDLLLADVNVQINSLKPHGEVDLDITGWNVMSARLGDETAVLARVGKDLNQLRVFLPDAATHTLKLSLNTTLKRTGNEQLTSVGVLAAAASQFKVQIPAERYLHVESLKLARPTAADQVAEYVFPAGGLKKVDLLITDQSQSSRPDVLTFASTAYGVRVEPSEITWSARTELQVFGQPIQELVCRVPQTLEITGVQSDGLESWELSNETEHPGRVTIRLKYQQPFEGNRALLLEGILSESPDKPWQVPDLTLEGVTSHSGKIVIGFPATVRLQTLESQGVRTAPLETASGDHASLGAEWQVYEVWQEDFNLRFVVTLKEQRVQAALTSLLFAGEQGLDLSVIASVQTRQVPLFDVRVRIPAEYRLLSATRDGNRVDWDIVPLDAAINEVRIALNPPLSPGHFTTLALQAQATPDGWPVQQTPLLVALPEVRLPQADMVEALYSISAPDDLDLVPQNLTGLDPAGQQDLDVLNQKLQATGQKIRLGFTYQDTVFQGQLQISRKPTRFTAETLTFFRVDRESVFTRLEGRLSFTGGGLRELSVQLSESAGDRLRFELLSLRSSAMPAKLIEQLPGEVANGLRTWTLKFDRYLQGDFILVTESQSPRGEATSFAPVRMLFPQASAQSGYLAIEGPQDVQVNIQSQTEAGLPLPVVDPVDMPLGQYSPVERVIAGYRLVRPDWNVTVSTTPFDREAIPAAIAHTASLSSVWSPGAAFQHQVTYTFTAIGMQSLYFVLPDDAKLWSTVLDDQAIEVRKDGPGSLVPLAGLNAQSQHVLQLVYSTPAISAEESGWLATQAPVLSVISGSGERQPLQVLQQVWELHSPREMIVTKARGDFRPEVELDAYTTFSRMLQRIRNFDQSDWLKGTITLVVLGLVLLSLRWLRVLVAGNWNLTRLVEWSIVVVIILILVALLLPAVQQAREAGRRSELRSRMRQLELEMENERAAAEAVSDAPVAADEFRKNAVDELKEMGKSEKAPQSGDAKPASTIPQAPPVGKPAPAIAPGEDKARDGLAVPPMDPLNRPSPERLGLDDTAAKLGRQFATGGLLSMNLQLQIPAESHALKLTYDGNNRENAPLNLRVYYANRTAGYVLMLTIVFGVGLLGYWIRNAAISVRVLFSFLTLVVPVALIGVAPPTLLLILQGIFLGGLLALLVWCLVCCSRCLRSCTSEFFSRCCRGPGLFGFLVFALMATSSVQADEPADKKVAPAPVQPYVVVPYKTLAEIPQADRVWVPAALFKQLWEVAHPEENPNQKASVPFAVADAQYVATLVPDGEAKRVQINARWVVMNFTDVPQQVPLPLTNRGLRNVKTDGEPGDLISIKNSEVAIRISDRGTHVVDAEVLLPSIASEETGSFRLDALPVPAGQLTVELPTPDEALQIKVNGASGSYQRTIAEDISRFVIPVDRGGNITVAWAKKKAEEAQMSRFQLDSAIQATIEDAGVRTQQRVSLQVRSGPVQELFFNLPQQLGLRQVSGPDVSGWEVQVEDKVKRLKVVFNRTIIAQGSQTHVDLDLFQSHQIGETGTTVALSMAIPVGAEHEVGQIALIAPDSLRVRPLDAQNLQQIDAGQLKPAPAAAVDSNSIQVAYKFISRPVTLSFEVSRRAAEVRGTVEHGVQIGRRKIVIASRILLKLTGAPRRMAEVQLPPNYLTLDVVCANASDWYVVPADDHSRLILEFDRPRTGDIEIGLEGHIVKNPDDPTVTINVPATLDTNRSTIQLGVWCDETYQASLNQPGKWKTISTPELQQTILNLRPQAPQFAFQTTDGVSPLELKLNRAVPDISADAGILIAVGDATVDYGFTLRWNIANAATDQFSLTVPAWLGHLDFTGPGIRQVQPEQLQGGRTRWHLSLTDAVRGQYLVTAAATIASPADLLVQTPRLEFESRNDVGTFTPLPTQRQFAVLVNLSQSQLSAADLEQFESVSADELPLTMPPQLVQQAMEVVRVREGKIPAWKMQQLERVSTSQAVVPSSVLTTILQLDGSWRTQVSYVVRNRGQQFLALKLPVDSQVMSVFVREAASRTVVTKLNDETIHLIALPQMNAADLSFEIRLTLEGRLAHALPESFSLAGQEVRIPAPFVVTPQESAEFGVTVAQTIWNVYVPDELEAIPVDHSRATNVIFHRQSGWIATQMQSLDRLRADVLEMKRVVNDVNISSSQRNQAYSNLKYLESQLKLQQIETYRQGSSSYAAPESLQSYSVESNRVLKESEAISQEVKQLLEKQQSSPQRQSQQGDALEGMQEFSNSSRAFIDRSNGILMGANTITSPQGKDTANSSQLNFYEPQDARRGAMSGKKLNEERNSREQLRSQVIQQAPIVVDQSNAVQKSKQDSNQEMSQRFTPPAGSLGIGSRQMGGPAFRVPQSEQSGGQQSQPGQSSDPFARSNVRGRIEMGQNRNGVTDRLPLGIDQDGESGNKSEFGFAVGGGMDPASGPVAVSTPHPKTTTQGLSVAMTLPQGGQELSFDKLGGNPELTLSIRPRQTYSMVYGVLWGVVVFCLGVWMLRRLFVNPTQEKTINSVVLLLILIGAAGFLLSSEDSSGWFFLLFCVSGLVWVFLPVRQSVTARS